jgi:hypothetical protein
MRIGITSRRFAKEKHKNKTNKTRQCIAFGVANGYIRQQTGYAKRLKMLPCTK